MRQTKQQQNILVSDSENQRLKLKLEVKALVTAKKQALVKVIVTVIQADS